jgi:hypothetical protein
MISNLLLLLLSLVGCTSETPTSEKEQQCTNTFTVDGAEEEEDDHNGHQEEDVDDTDSEIILDPFLSPREAVLPELLSETPLYSDLQSKTIHQAILHFTPAYELWSDGEDKDRWIYIPECEKVNTIDINDWQFPIGTRLFKEFALDGKRIETRIIERIGVGPRDFAYASYQWNDEQTEATRVPEEGVKNVNGTSHNIPSKSQCLQCHGSYAYSGGRPSRGLGFSGLQLAHTETATTLDYLILNDKLSHPPEIEINLPGDEKTKDALGYLHANCGNCHNDSKDGLVQNDLNLWLDVGLQSPEQSNAWKSAVDQPTTGFMDQHISGRIVSGNPQESAILYRMIHRANNAQMPPIGTDIVDEEGVQIIQQWIEALP